jgi:hypothetical protein
VLNCADSLNRGKLSPTGARIATTFRQPQGVCVFLACIAAFE